jgi:hypothetical protein
VLIPAEIRDKRSYVQRVELIIREDGAGVRLTDRARSIRKAQEQARKVRQKGGSAVDDLIRQRREEARREYGRQGGCP